MTFKIEAKSDIIKKYRNTENDTGSIEIQCAILTQRIKYLTIHLNEHKKDHSCRRSLLMLVNNRKKLLNYLKRKSQDRYNNIINRLGLRK